MDVPPCNPLLNLRFVALVLSRTLNGSSDVKQTNEELKRPAALPAFFCDVRRRVCALTSPCTSNKLLHK
jgi:hypothetical protein